ncbi:MAG TPA: Uma2 family endonuclease [Cyclobacteriaceae bacterium]
MTRATTTIDLSTPAMKAWAKLPVGVLAEVINDQLEILASPSPYHQRTLLKVTLALAAYITNHKSGELFCAPVDVHLKEGVVVIPDIVYIAKDNPIIIANNGLHGSPDLHIGFLSPRNKKRDLITKKKLYEQTDVKEYWIIDPIGKDTQGYLLRDGRYDEPLEMKSEINVRILKKKIRF